MGVILSWNWRRWDPDLESEVVGHPNPHIDKTVTLWPYQRLAQMAPEISAARFTVVMLGPSCECGGGPFSDGYDLKDNYSLDNTAFGDGEMLRQCVAQLHAHGLQVYGDLVLHQYGGGRSGHYATAKFPKTPTCFARISTPGGVDVDVVPSTEGNFPFGDMAAYQHSLPAGYMFNGARDAAQWQRDTVDFDGYRIDDVKGTYAPVVYETSNSPAFTGRIVIAEYFEGSNDPLSNWVFGYMQGRPYNMVYDFGFKFNVGHICNNNSTTWMGWLSHIGFVTVHADRAVTFIDSADTDNSPGQETIWNKILGYAIMLTFPGYPMVYWRDWSTDPHCYGLKHAINNLIWIHETLAGGAFVVRLGNDKQVFVHERLGWGDQPGCVCFFNNDRWNVHTRTVQTNFGPHQRVHEYTGLGDYNDTWTDEQGRLTASVPANNNGRSYLVYARPMDDPGHHPEVKSTYQLFQGWPELGPLTNGSTSVGRIDARKGTRIHCNITVGPAGVTHENHVEFTLHDASGKQISGFATLQGEPHALLDYEVEADGWIALYFLASGLPAGGLPYQVWVQYTAPPAPTL